MLCDDVEITEAMIRRAAKALGESGALAGPVFGLGVLAEKILRAGLLHRRFDTKGRTANLPPSKIALKLDRCL